MRYTYQCEKQGCNYFETISLQVNERNNVRICPKCQTVMVRLISKPNFVLNGEGFFAQVKKDEEMYTPIKEKDN